MPSVPHLRISLWKKDGAIGEKILLKCAMAVIVSGAQSMTCSRASFLISRSTESPELRGWIANPVMLCSATGSGGNVSWYCRDDSFPVAGCDGFLPGFGERSHF